MKLHLEERASLTPSVRGALDRFGVLALLAMLVLVWGLLMRQFGGADVYAVMGPFALVVMAAVLFVGRERLGSWCRADARALLAGTLLGVGMTLVTYPVYRVAIELWPPLDGTVRSLYLAASTTRLPIAVAWVTALVLAEELLWRGAFLEALDPRAPRRVASAISVVSYALAQLGSGSWVVFTLALVCGSVWTLLRRYTGSLVPSAIAHMIWTQTVILLVPVI